MKVIDCPVIGPRPLSEFVYGGEVRRPPMGDVALAAVADHAFNRSGAPTLLREWWFHRPTSRWFVLERDTVSDRVERVVPPEEVAYAIPML
ncbi:sarcosine oxidase subunit delta [Aquisalimonas asiatica]|uniref:Sarcosine oxidase subunit delta n=1 Tax=Aquisalimonas asiatica TaxID=406100 RepID=A0A1H8RZW6_9GAMM|nr:sarcosine oxidase subunit delta [Aquisalimonas asiatica]SEO71744.1 sarcosine oxidase subunit delta [Aquisalimonas asiatica]